MILESSINVARELNIISAAEGVETRADFELLRSLRCLMVQGYFIAKPTEASALPAWIEEWKRPGAGDGHFAADSLGDRGQADALRRPFSFSTERIDLRPGPGSRSR